jgi:hypothetical protein
MSYRQKQRLKTATEFCAAALAMLAFIYIVFLGMWKAMYPTCIPFYALQVFRVLDADTCKYEWTK